MDVVSPEYSGPFYEKQECIKRGEKIYDGVAAMLYRRGLKVLDANIFCGIVKERKQEQESEDFNYQ